MDPVLSAILLTTAISGAVSITAAGVMSFALASRMSEGLLSLSVGVMLATPLLHSLPDAFVSSAGAHALFATLLAGLLSFFLLEKCTLLRRGLPSTCRSLQHAGCGGHRHLSTRHSTRGAATMLLAGDVLHNFTDGVIVAAAFLANPGLGSATALAIIVHEIPQEISNFVVLLNAGYSRTRAYVFNLLCSLMAVAGGVLGYLTLGRASQLVPYVLAFASAGFLYIVLRHLIPELQRKDTIEEFLPQALLMCLGVALVWSIPG